MPEPHDSVSATVEPKTGVVAILDALGTRGTWERGDPGELVSDWEFVLDQFKQRAEKENAAPSTNTTTPETSTPQYSRVDVTGFSDTIIVSIEGRNRGELLRRLGVQVGVGIATGISRGIPLRGAIAIGKYYKSASIIVGPAVDQAHEWSQRADWIGAMLTPNASFLMSSLEREWKPFETHEYFQYEVPLKNEKSLKTWAVDWPSYLRIRRPQAAPTQQPTTMSPVAGRYKHARRARHLSWSGRRKLLQTFLADQVILPETVRKYEHTFAYFDHVAGEHERMTKDFLNKLTLPSTRANAPQP